MTVVFVVSDIGFILFIAQLNIQGFATISLLFAISHFCAKHFGCIFPIALVAEDVNQNFRQGCGS
jgi:fucose permease